MAYSSGPDDVHSVDPVEAGLRHTLTVWLTTDPGHSEDRKVRGWGLEMGMRGEMGGSRGVGGGVGSRLTPGIVRTGMLGGEVGGEG